MVTDLEPGFAYGAANKRIRGLAELTGVTVRAVDPGVRRTYTSVDLLTGDGDVRDSVRMLRSRSWHARLDTKRKSEKMREWRDMWLGDVQQRLSATPFRTSADPQRYARYVDATLAEWNTIWAFTGRRRRRKIRFRDDVAAQRLLDREVDRLCKPRPYDHSTLLLYGNGASTNLFGKTKKNVKGPARKLFDTAVRRKKAVCIWADEFRTSKLDIYGRPVVHPRETRADRLQPAACRAQEHGAAAPGCICACSHRGCVAPRTRARWCAHHYKPQLRYDVCYSNQRSLDGHQHRMWNRDVVGALNIGCLFLAQALGLDTALWRRGTYDSTAPAPQHGRGGEPTLPLSWAEIFVCGRVRVPFSLPLAKPPAGGLQSRI